jgi:hypothetical protein
MKSLFYNFNSTLCPRRLFGAILILYALVLVYIQPNNPHISEILLLGSGLIGLTTLDHFADKGE